MTDTLIADDDWNGWEDEDWSEDEACQFFVIKWLADGATTLGEVSASLTEFASYLQGLEDKGFRLRHSVDNGHGEYYHPDGTLEADLKQ